MTTTEDPPPTRHRHRVAHDTPARWAELARAAECELDRWQMSYRSRRDAIRKESTRGEPRNEPA